MDRRIVRLDVKAVKAATVTNWVFVELETAAGCVGLGEACLSGEERELVDAMGALAANAIGRDILDLDMQVAARPQRKRADLAATIRSAIDQAVWDVKAQLLDRPLQHLLGGGRRQAIPLYANINRALATRTPEGTADVAARAVRAGFAGVKCAPLDGITPHVDGKQFASLFERAVERVEAVRDAIGPHIKLMVDCHWRLPPVHARSFVARVESCDLMWLEDPFPEEAVDEWRTLHRDTGMPLAGGERATSLRELATALAEEQYQFACPDVRHIGGVSALWHAAHLVHAHGARFAPHNPRGPVGTLASAHVCAVAPDLVHLEHAFGECDWRSELVLGQERIDGGSLAVPTIAGVGARLDEDLLARHPFDPVSAPRMTSDVDVW